jgi:hypothetical protein
MLAEGRRAAHERGVTNIRWVQALAEDLPGAAPGPYRVVTFGQSFHWTDEARVAEAVYDMLAPGGALALIVHTVEGRPAPASPGPPPIPHAEIRALVEKYLGSTRRAGQGVAPVRTHRFEDVLVRTRFGAPRAIFAPGIPDLLRDSESVLSGYFSRVEMTPRAVLRDKGTGTNRTHPPRTSCVSARSRSPEVLSQEEMVEPSQGTGFVGLPRRSYGVFSVKAWHTGRS